MISVTRGPFEAEVFSSGDVELTGVKTPHRYIWFRLQDVDLLIELLNHLKTTQTEEPESND